MAALEINIPKATKY